MLYLGHDFIRLSNAFVLPDPKPPIINIGYGWSGACGHCKLINFLKKIIL